MTLTYQPVCMLVAATSSNTLFAAILFLVGTYLRTLCFGRFPPPRSHSSVLHEFANCVFLLTALVRSFPIALRPLVNAQTCEIYGLPNAIEDVVRVRKSSRISGTVPANFNEKR